MKLNEIRKTFLEFFRERRHEIVPSSALVPNNDPSLLFTNSGMVQFKDIFLGIKKPPCTRVASSQGCIRAGGKHNDLENVGYTSRHHTFFEMLGNFSFGDYFKRDAIRFSWSFLTDILKIDPQKLHITVHKDDEESKYFWLTDIKIDPSRISYNNNNQNFWSMGNSGPCGPCTEIFYDYGENSVSSYRRDRYVEIWNIVFMQFIQNIDGIRKDLPTPCVDTGMGLERIAAVMQNAQDNYQIDLFQYLLNGLSTITNYSNTEEKSMRVIADHIRSTALLLAEGVCPSNDKHGYVVRRIIRRAVRHGNKLGQKKPFFYKLVPYLVEAMEEAYPQLPSRQSYISESIFQEEEKFIKTLDKGIKIFEEKLHSLTGSDIISGDFAFKLYDTYGFPLDLTIDLSREYGLSVDRMSFEHHMKERRKQSKDRSSFYNVKTDNNEISEKSKFLGNKIHSWVSKVTRILKNSKNTHVISVGESGCLILNCSPFYPEAGGQVGDTGYISGDLGVFLVSDTKKIKDCIIHYGRVIKGKIKLDDSIYGHIDLSRRNEIAIHHSATHLLHSALRKNLGSSVTQKGSLVKENQIRFDFSYAGILSDQDIQKIEDTVNHEILSCNQSEISEINHKYLTALNVISLFDLSESQTFIRIVNFGDFSSEACCGTHVECTKDINLFKIISHRSVAAGTKRIEAVAGKTAISLLINREEELKRIAKVSNASIRDVYDKVAKVVETSGENIRRISQIQQDFAIEKAKNFLKHAKKIGNIEFLFLHEQDIESNSLNYIGDFFKTSTTPLVTLISYSKHGKNLLLSTVSRHCLDFMNAIDLINVAGGNGGGRKDVARGIKREKHSSKMRLILERWIAQKVDEIMRARKDSNLRPPSS